MTITANQSFKISYCLKIKKILFTILTDYCCLMEFTSFIISSSYTFTIFQLKTKINSKPFFFRKNIVNKVLIIFNLTIITYKIFIELFVFLSLKENKLYRCSFNLITTYLFVHQIVEKNFRAFFFCRSVINTIFIV